MQQKRFELLDTATGELVPAVTWIRRSWKGEEYFMGFQQAFILLAQDKELSLEAKNVLLYMFGRLDFENFILVPQAEIGEKLSMHQPNVSKAISLLVEKGILIEGPKVNRSHSYRLNHQYGWKGTLKNLNKLRAVEIKKYTRQQDK